MDGRYQHPYQPTEDNSGDGLSKVFVCTDPAKFSDSGYDGYAHVGNEARAEGYVKEVIFGEGGEIMPSVVGGGSSTYFCDYHYTNIPTTEAIARCPVRRLCVSRLVCRFCVCAFG